MRTSPRITIPGRYLLKLLIEVVLFGAVMFIYSLSHTWLNEYEKFGAPVNVLLRFILFLFGTSLAVRLLAMIYRHRIHLPYNKKDNVTIGLSNISLTIITIWAIISVFGLFGLSPERIFTSLSIVAAAFAILSKDFITDIISGIVIAFSREISIDDFVKIGDLRGKIIDINITKTALLNEDDDIIFLPNSTVFTSEIINYTKKQIKKTSIDFEVALDAFPSVEQLEAQIIQGLEEYAHLIEPNSYFLRVVHIHKDHLQLKFQYSLLRFTRDMERTIKRKAVRNIVRLLNKPKTK